MDSPHKGDYGGASSVHFTVQGSLLKMIQNIYFFCQKFNPDMSDSFSHFYIKNPICIINVREAHYLYHEMCR